MYGGSGTCPMASIVSRTDDPSSVHSLHRAPAMKMAADDLSMKHVARCTRAPATNLIREPSRSRWPGCTSAIHVSPPSLKLQWTGSAANQETLRGAAAGQPRADQPRREHARVVDDQQIAGTKE